MTAEIVRFPQQNQWWTVKSRTFGRDVVLHARIRAATPEEAVKAALRSRPYNTETERAYAYAIPFTPPRTVHLGGRDD